MRYLGGQSGLKAALVLENLKVQPPMPVGQDGWPGWAPHQPWAPASGLCPQGVPAEAPDLGRGAGGARAEASGLRQRLGEDGDRLPADPVGAAPETGPEGAEVAGEGVWGPATLTGRPPHLPSSQGAAGHRGRVQALVLDWV